jgi:hypothetical protein
MTNEENKKENNGSNNGNNGKGLSDEQKEKLRKIREMDRMTSKYVSLTNGEDLDMLFDLNKITETERTFRGGKSKTFIHMVTIPKWNGAKPKEKEFSLAPTFARDLWKRIEETGKLYFNVRREGASADETKYHFTPL